MRLDVEDERMQVAADLGYTGKAGVLVQQVMPGSPAAGILQQADILTDANGESLTEVEILIEHVALAGVGGKLTLTVFREKKIQEVEVTVGAAPTSSVKG